MTDLNEYKDLYLKTALEYVLKMDTHLKALATDVNNPIHVEELHRSAHSLKSQSLVMGYQSTGELCKVIEHIFSAVQEKHLAISDQLTASLAQSIQKLYDSIENIKVSEKEADLWSQVTQLEEASSAII